MDDKTLIKKLGGSSRVARLVSKKLKLDGDEAITRQRVNYWRKANRIPPYFKLACKSLWDRAGNIKKGAA